MSRTKSVILKYKNALINHLVDISKTIPPFSFCSLIHSVNQDLVFTKYHFASGSNIQEKLKLFP